MDTSSNNDILLAVYEGQRAESLQHRQSLFNAYSLSLAGLMALAAGVLATPKPTLGLRIAVGIMVIIVCFSMFKLICKQRRESEKSMSIMRDIESYFRLFVEGSFIPGKTVLPQGFAEAQKLKFGLTWADWLQAGVLIFVGCGIISILILLPCQPN